MAKIKIAALLLAVGLAGCGYHLQRPEELPPAMQRTVIVASNPYSSLVRSLTRTLSGTNIKVVRDPKRATAELHILHDDSGRRVLSVDNRDRPQEYELHYIVTFSLTHGAQMLMAPQTVTLTRNFVFDPNSVLAGNAQASRLLDAMQRDAVQVIVRRLAAAARAKSGEPPAASL